MISLLLSQCSELRDHVQCKAQLDVGSDSCTHTSIIMLLQTHNVLASEVDR